MKALILDDEPYCVELLAHLLGKHCPEVEIAATFTDAPLALEYLRTQPSLELCFLDVEMPRLNAFDMLNLLHPFHFKIVFTTAYDKYAVKAIKYSALDYLLKPIDIEELKAAVQRVALQHSIQARQLELLSQHRNGASIPDRIALATSSGIDFVTVGDIIYCGSDGSYSEIRMEAGHSVVLAKTLKDLEELLPADYFCRIHRSYLLNLRHVRHYTFGAGGEVIMSNGQQLPVARNRKAELLKRLGLEG